MYGSSQDPTFPTMFNEPLGALSMMVPEMKLWKALQESAFGKLMEGGTALSNALPLNEHFNGVKKSVTSTPSVIYDNISFFG